MTTLEWLEELHERQQFQNQIRNFGLSITNIANPGWSLEVPLRAEEKDCSIISIDRSDSDWFMCRIRENELQGCGGAGNLQEILETFKEWVVGHSSDLQSEDPLLTWLQEYYMICCNEDWEHEYGITIQTEKDQGWYVKIDLNDLNLEEVYFKPVCVKHNVGDWVECEVFHKKFIGRGGPRNLREIIQIFQQWVEDFCASDA